jgi:hypothetical protein
MHFFDFVDTGGNPVHPAETVTARRTSVRQREMRRAELQGRRFGAVKKEGP